jgi:hypothetical protein
VIPFPEVFAYQEPVDGQVLVATFGGDLRVPGVLVRQPGGRTAVFVGVPDLLVLSDASRDVGVPVQVGDQAGEPAAAAELAGTGFFESAGAGDGHAESVEVDLFDGPPEPPRGGRELADVDTRGRV